MSSQDIPGGRGCVPVDTTSPESSSGVYLTVSDTEHRSGAASDTILIALLPLDTHEPTSTASGAG